MSFCYRDRWVSLSWDFKLLTEKNLENGKILGKSRKPWGRGQHCLHTYFCDSVIFCCLCTSARNNLQIPTHKVKNTEIHCLSSPSLWKISTHVNSIFFCAHCRDCGVTSVHAQGLRGASDHKDGAQRAGIFYHKRDKNFDWAFCGNSFFCPPLLLVVLMGAKKWQFLPAELGGPSFTRVPQGLWVGWGPCGPGCFFFFAAGHGFTKFPLQMYFVPGPEFNLKKIAFKTPDPCALWPLSTKSCHHPISGCSEYAWLEGHRPVQGLCICLFWHGGTRNHTFI